MTIDIARYMASLYAMGIDHQYSWESYVAVKSIDIRNSTAIGRATRYSRGTILVSEEQFTTGRNNITYQPITTNTDFSMQLAILLGLYDSLGAISQRMTVCCPGTHCEWQPYTSIAICSTCVDVTNLWTKSTVNLTTSQESQRNLLSIILNPGASLQFNGRELTTYNLTQRLYLEDGGDHSVLLVSYVKTNRSKTAAFQDHKLLLYPLTVMNLEYCVKNYTLEMSNGTLSGTPSPLTSITLPPSWEQLAEPWGHFSTPGSLETKNINLGATGFYLSDSEHTSNSMQLIYNSAALNTLFTGLALNMSYSTRSNDDKGTLVQGTVGITVYNVRMRWIALPVFSVFGGCLLLGLTAFFESSGSSYLEIERIFGAESWCNDGELF
ncbi:uncharacterized protein PAC_13797 [Phialocephala subalpina]|uniref:Uncharacterized protein n=1 Tax=Phialocephala subalpina TaxID=576137 RepID=A0A1L7XFT4_9HELO|nr:uncharacterized protein PAC_13797 [Phialocephala subalpina]